MHHVPFAVAKSTSKCTKIKDLKSPNKKLDFFTRQMAAINRKQIPLCKDHHVRLHNDT